MSCGKKRRPTYESAIAAAIRCSRRGKPLRVYHCDDCGGWHLTSRVQVARPPAPPSPGAATPGREKTA